MWSFWLFSLATNPDRAPLAAERAHVGQKGGTMMETRRPGWLVLAALVGVALSAARAHAGADEGKGLYEQKCKACHSIGNDAGKMANLGGKLDGVGAKRDAAWLKAYIADPKSKMPDAKMPKIKLEPAQLDDIVAYMMTLKEPAPAK
jgi:mono/diheme cytochrome c family protein